MTDNEKRQASLFAILPRAVKAAKEGRTEIAVLHAPCFVDDYDEGEHVYCPKEAVNVLYPVTPRFASMRVCDAVVSGDGSVFFTKVEDTLEAIKGGVGKFKTITLADVARAEEAK